MHWRHREPTLEQMLCDPIVRALMDADGVDPHELEAMLKEVGRTRRARCALLGTMVGGFRLASRRDWI
jgi:hypothetical protein